jgi:phosphoglycolate phosphatase-like HAD superfamily hydrolase
LIGQAGAESSATLMVGDSVIDWRTAHAASVRSCTVRYGFGFDGFPADAATDADAFVDAPAELLGLL